MQRFTRASAIFLVLTAFSTPAFAENKYGHPVIKGAEIPHCYMITENNLKLDLTRLCGQVTANTQIAGASVSTGVTGASSSGGNCQYSYQLDSLGRRCGGRAADKRPGGK